MALIDSDKLGVFGTLKYSADEGIVVPATSDVKSSVEEAFTSNDMFGGDFDITEENIGGRLVEGATRLIVETLGLCAINANQLNFEYALGRYLDAQASFFGISRNGATATTVVCSLGGDAGLVIPKGQLVSDDDGRLYELTATVVLNSDGVGNGTFACQEKGPIEVSVGAISTIVSSGVLGWDSVLNEVAGITGKDKESDASLRSRIRTARQAGIGYLSGIRSGILSIPEVKECLVYENFFGSPIWVDSVGNISMTYSSSNDAIGIKSHSILVVADYVDSEDTDYSVAEAIYKTKSCGSGMTPILTNSTSIDYANEKNNVHIPEQVNVTEYAKYVKNIRYLDTDVQAYYSIYFNKPFKKWAYVEIDVNSNAYVGTSQDLRADIIAAIDAFQNGNSKNVDGLTIGQNILAFELASGVSDEIPSIQVRSVLFLASWEAAANRPSSPESLTPTNTSFVSGSDDSVTEITIKMSQKGVIDTSRDVRVKIDGVVVSGV